MLKSKFVAVNRLFVLSCLNQDYYYYLIINNTPKGIISNHNVIINGKNFYDQAIDSYIKRCEEIRKLKIGQGEDYILLDVY